MPTEPSVNPADDFATVLYFTKGSGGNGADPLNATAPAGWEQFRTVIPARCDQVVRGVSFTPGSLLFTGYQRGDLDPGHVGELGQDVLEMRIDGPLGDE